MNEPSDFERLICKTVDQIYNENMRLYLNSNDSHYLNSGWDNLNGLYHLLLIYKNENEQSAKMLIKLVKSFQDRIRDHIKTHYDNEVK